MDGVVASFALPTKRLTEIGIFVAADVVNTSEKPGTPLFAFLHPNFCDSSSVCFTPSSQDVARALDALHERLQIAFGFLVFC